MFPAITSAADCLHSFDNEIALFKEQLELVSRSSKKGIIDKLMPFDEYIRNEDVKAQREKLYN